MSILEIQKKQLQHKIAAIEDEKLIQKIIDLVSEEEGHYALSDKEKELIARGRKEVAEGKTITNEEAKKLNAEWLKSKK